MAVHRLAVLAAVGLLLIAAAFVATRATRSGEAEAPLPAPATAPAKAGAAGSPARGAAKRPAATPTKPRGPDGMPMPVVRALADRRVVVLFFTQRAADDWATKAGIRAVRDLPGVAAFTDRIDRVGRYRRLVSGLGVSQAPSIVVVQRNLRARLLEGYVDSASLRQFVADAGKARRR